MSEETKNGMERLTGHQLPEKQPLFHCFQCRACGKTVLRRGLASHGLAHVRKGEAVAELKPFSSTYVFYVKGGAS